MSFIKETVHYDLDEKIELFLSAIRANKVCDVQRKTFNLCRVKSPVAVIPEHCINESKALIDCFQQVLLNKEKGEEIRM